MISRLAKHNNNNIMSFKYHFKMNKCSNAFNNIHPSRTVINGSFLI